MKLVASVIVRNELGRYLEECVGHLLEFCDEVRVLDDASDDGTSEWLTEVHHAALQVRRRDAHGFYEHEGLARQELLEWTLAGEPDYVLAIDADEFVADPSLIRRAMKGGAPVCSLVMEEVWEVDAAADCLCVREDGGWRSHPVSVLWAPSAGGGWRIADRALACGRVPEAVQRARYAAATGTEILHFGWANEAERAARHARYAEHDGGRFHRSAHLDSILWPCEQVDLRGRRWPPALEARRGALQAAAAAHRA